MLRQCTGQHPAYSFNCFHRWDGVGVSRGVDVSCAFLLGKPREVKDPLFFEPPSRGLPGIEEGALIEIVNGVFGLPDSPSGWWKELRDTLQGDSWTSLKLDPAFFCLRDLSGHFIGMIIVHVDDMLLATNNSHQAESNISRLIFKNKTSKM